MPHIAPKFKECDLLNSVSLDEDTLSDENIKICRACLVVNQMNMILLDIEDNVDDFMSFSGVELSPNEELSLWLCSMCCRLLQRCRHFRSRCQEADRALSQWLAGRTNHKTSIGDVSQLPPLLSLSNRLVISASDCRGTGASAEAYSEGGHLTNHCDGLLFPIPAELVLRKEELATQDNLKGNIALFSKENGHIFVGDSDVYLVKVESDEMPELVEEGTVEWKEIIRCEDDKETNETNLNKVENKSNVTDNTFSLKSSIKVESKNKSPTKKTKGKALTCILCKRSFLSTRRLLAHRSRCLTQKSHNTTSPTELQLPRDASTSETLHRCGSCDRSFLSVANLAAHERSHALAAFYCVACDKTFKTSTTLKTHLKWSSSHVDPQLLKFPCSQCPVRYQREAQLEQHRAAAHFHLRPHTCPTCPASYSQLLSLRRHIRHRHENVPKPRNYSCEICGRAFITKKTLINHIRTHTGERPFSCQICGRSFAQEVAMRTHVKCVHLGVSYTRKVKTKIKTREKIKPSPIKIVAIRNINTSSATLRPLPGNNLNRSNDEDLDIIFKKAEIKTYVRKKPSLKVISDKMECTDLPLLDEEVNSLSIMLGDEKISNEEMLNDKRIFYVKINDGSVVDL